MAIANFSVPEKLAKEQISLLENANKNGKIRIGVNETTKAVERSKALLVLVAEDVNPEEIVMHLPLICKEKNIPCSFVKTKKELGNLQKKLQSKIKTCFRNN